MSPDEISFEGMKIVHEPSFDELDGGKDRFVILSEDQVETIDRLIAELGRAPTMTEIIAALIHSKRVTGGQT